MNQETETLLALKAEVRLTRLITKDALYWSAWEVLKVEAAIRDRRSVELSDGGYVHPDHILTFYSAEKWVAKQAAADRRREENIQRWKEEHPEPTKRHRWGPW